MNRSFWSLQKKNTNINSRKVAESSYLSLRSIDLFQLIKIPETTEIIDFYKLRSS